MSVYRRSHENLKRPILSIITTTMCDFDGLQRTVDSLGTFPGLATVEVIIVEGHESDSEPSQNIRSRIAGWNAAIWIQGTDDGVYDAFNRALIAASGEWVWFVNSGDRVANSLDESFLIAALSEIAPEVEWLLGDTNVVSPDGSVRRVKLSAGFSAGKLLTGEYVPCHQAVMVRRTVLADIGMFNTSLAVSADYDLFLRLVRRGEPTLWNIRLVDYLEGGLSDRTFHRNVWQSCKARRHRLDRSRKDVFADTLTSIRRACTFLIIGGVRSRRRKNAGVKRT